MRSVIGLHRGKAAYNEAEIGHTQKRGTISSMPISGSISGRR